MKVWRQRKGRLSGVCAGDAGFTVFSDGYHYYVDVSMSTGDCLFLDMTAAEFEELARKVEIARGGVRLAASGSSKQRAVGRRKLTKK